jgi:hypothetical protein
VKRWRRRVGVACNIPKHLDKSCKFLKKTAHRS